VDSRFTAAHRGGSGTPLVCIHGFTDTWRTWELVLPDLERKHDVLAPTLLGHAGGPALDSRVGHERIVDAIEAAMDDAGFETAHLVGNSLGGYIACVLAARGRARTVVALAPAGGWADGDAALLETMDYFERTYELVRAAAPHADEIASTPEGRRRTVQSTAVNYEHIPPDLIAHLIRGMAECPAVLPMIEYARTHPYELDASAISCPVRIVWGVADAILPWPTAAARYRDDWLPAADWVILDGVGHCPQFDVPLETAQLILGFIEQNER
jgi:pimeloyl-ACP methyl ester carboxylesterase